MITIKSRFLVKKNLLQLGSFLRKMFWDYKKNPLTNVLRILMLLIGVCNNYRLLHAFESGATLQSFTWVLPNTKLTKSVLQLTLVICFCS